jgi:urea transport system ATP-binding protein
MASILKIAKLNKQYGAVKVLDDLNLEITAGTLRCLLGPNGAGKTTAMDMITGRQKPDSGTITFNGQVITGHQEHAIARAGIGRKFQVPAVFRELSVLENLTVASSEDVNPFRATFRFAGRKDRAKTSEIAERVGLENRLDVEAGRLSHGEIQWLEIGMVLAQNPKLLLMDEPTAGMTEGETAKTAAIFNGLKTTHTLLVVEHDMAFVREIADVVTVMHLGHVLSEGPISVVEADQRVRDVYLGTEEVADVT